MLPKSLYGRHSVWHRVVVSSDAHRLYSDLAKSVQSVLLSHRTASGSVIEALAELEIDHRLFDHDIGGEWAVSHLYEAAATG